MRIAMTMLFIVFGSAASAQVLTTAETLGAGNHAVLVSENHLYDTSAEPTITLNIAYVQYVRGITNRFDAYFSLGETHIFGEDQFWVSVGGNTRLFRTGGASVSLFTIASVPLHRHNEACTTLVNAAIVVSRTLSSKVSLYTGVNSLLPIGARDRGLFTPPDNKVNVPAGLAVTIGEWGIFGEVDIGRLKSVGIGLSKVL